MQYDMVQYAANRKDVEAALKLVEAGAKWQLPKGQRVIGSTIFYPPEILHTYMRLTKVGLQLPVALGVGVLILRERILMNRKAVHGQCTGGQEHPLTTTHCEILCKGQGNGDHARDSSQLHQPASA
jgi:hypothetical protein